MNAIRLDRESASTMLPVHLRPGAIPLPVWERLRWRIDAEADEIQVVHLGTAASEVWASLSGEYVRELDPDIDAGAMLIRKVRRHYLMVHRPELLVC